MTRAETYTWARHPTYMERVGPAKRSDESDLIERLVAEYREYLSYALYAPMTADEWYEQRDYPADEPELSAIGRVQFWARAMRALL